MSFSECFSPPDLTGIALSLKGLVTLGTTKPESL